MAQPYRGTKGSDAISRTLLLLICVATAAAVHVKMEELEDGVLMQDTPEVRHQAGEWTVVLGFDAPSGKKEMKSLLTDLRLKLREYRDAPNATDDTTADMWLKRLNDVSFLAQPYTLHRSKRGLLDAGGSILKFLFGTATEAEVSHINELLQHTVAQQQAVVHVVDNLVTVVNRTQQTALVNRQQIGKLQKYVMKVTQFINDQVTGTLNLLNQQIQKVDLDLRIEIILGVVETLVLAYRRQEADFHRLRAAVEMGRLTEDSLPSQELRVIEDAAKRYGLETLPELWYYKNIIVYPMYVSSERVLFKAALPLIDKSKYQLYRVLTWPVPYPKRVNLTIEVKVPETFVINTGTGDIIQPSRCVGEHPAVCHNTPVFRRSLHSCLRGLITRSKTEVGTCPFQIKPMTEETQIQEVGPNQYVIVSVGETARYHCPGQTESIVNIARGTHLIVLDNPCVLRGPNWLIHSIFYTISNTTYMYPKRPKHLNLTIRVPEAVALDIMDNIQGGVLPDAALMPLDKVKIVPYYAFSRNRTTYGLSITIILIVMIGIAGVCCYKKCPKLYRNYVSKSKSLEPTVQYDASNSRLSTIPFAYFETPANSEPLSSHNVVDELIEGVRRVQKRTHGNDSPEDGVTAKKVCLAETSVETPRGTE